MLGAFLRSTDLIQISFVFQTIPLRISNVFVRINPLQYLKNVKNACKNIKFINRVMKNFPIYIYAVALLVSITILFSGCDVSDSNTANSTDEPSQPEFRITNDLQNRVNKSNGNIQVNSRNNKRKVDVQVTFIANIQSPIVKDSVTRASKLSYNENTKQIYVGYKIFGEPFGGGIDVINASDPQNLQSGVLSIESDNLDVQEVTFDSNTQALYVAGALDPSSQNAGSSTIPSRLSRLTFNDNGTEIASQTHRELSGNVAKSVVVGSDFVHAIDDEQTLYQYDLFLEESSRQTLVAGNARGFRSVAQMNTPGQPLVFVLDRSGKIYRVNKNSFNQFQESIDLLSDEEIPENAIARLQAHSTSSPPMLLAALNNKGFAVTNPTGTQTWDVQNGRLYTSVTGATINGTTYVFAASTNGTFEVYEDDFQRSNIEASEALAQFNIPKITEGAVDSSQINDIIAVDSEGDESARLYIANSDQGIVVLDISISAI